MRRMRRISGTTMEDVIMTGGYRSEKARSHGPNRRRPVSNDFSCKVGGTVCLRCYGLDLSLGHVSNDYTKKSTQS